MLTKWMVTRAEYDALRCDYLALVERVAKLEAPKMNATSAADRQPGKSIGGVNTELRRPSNTWRTRSTNFTKQSLSDPSTFPQQVGQSEVTNVPEK